MKYRKYFLKVFFLLLASTAAIASEPNKLDTLDILIAAKFAGACGILDSTINFQSTTQMQGGDEFVARYWATEAARLGMTMQQYSDQCNKAIRVYSEAYKALESKK